ncbi:DUF1446-domain-containing protein [Hortaea werneckii]|nr:DUF1446-domain-containing protein [Hortaea werneckii]KAI6832465.1 DUF1446-domain-containing protein [Hortaea werneckii]KAI6909518.1 DUF1446-domain-containing protein [Hortaea werneckii]KAI6934925.1 DUF1446-domain-containing protein [Hortaea werneckii]KAI6959397.1 DUF1446-domain-containing protein [Hortaea werneckii]
MSSPKRPIRIAGCSGAATDRRHAMAMLAANCPNDPIDVIMGDWMSEANMTSRAALKIGEGGEAAYEPTFVESLEPALSDIAKHGIKLAVNAGASDTALLHKVVTDMVKAKGLQLKVAWISGDEVLPAIEKAQHEGKSEFVNICTGEKLADWSFKPIYAQAYLGGLGIAAAFAEGADIVICGRVSDASPVIGAAYWWHNWRRDQLLELANAFVAGHLIECSSYVCGGNFTGFKSLEARGWDNIGFPIAEIAHTGQVIITKNRHSGGEVSTQTCTSQLLYEIQGPWYFNSDVTAILTNLWFEQIGTDRVALHGVEADLPPPTTKVGLTAHGGYQAEIHYFLTGLDIDAKARMLESQCRRLLTPYSHRFTTLTFTQTGTALSNAPNQDAATVDFRIFAQAPTAEDLSPARFFRAVGDNIMQAYPGGTFHLDLRQAFPKPVFEYYVTLLPQTAIRHRVHLWQNINNDVDNAGREAEEQRVREIAPPEQCKEFPAQQPSQAATTAPTRGNFGPTTRGPLGWIVHARSGDKGSDCNVGFWVRFRDEWEWLRGTLSTETVKTLLAEEYKGKRIDRFELPNLYAVHFLLHDHLDRGVSCSSSYDFLGKNVAEYLRSKYVDFPTKFLHRGKL